jgi:hypothetical protein
MSGCVHERNPRGGFERLHGRLCFEYARGCEGEAVVHVGIVDGNWCANTCRHCAKAITQRHRAVAEEGLRGLEVESEQTL